MKIGQSAILVLLLATGTAFAQAAAYDYFVNVKGGTSNSPRRVVVQIGNNGPSAGPNYDVILTVTKGGQQVCATGLTTQPPIQKGQLLYKLQFELSYPRPKSRRPPSDISISEKYVFEALIKTQYPNDDTNPANGTQVREIRFPPGGQATCKNQ